MPTEPGKHPAPADDVQNRIIVAPEIKALIIKEQVSTCGHDLIDTHA